MWRRGSRGPRAVSEEGHGRRGLGWGHLDQFLHEQRRFVSAGFVLATPVSPALRSGVDPASDTLVIFLSNRVHPDGKGDVGSLRGRVASIVAASITDTSVTRAREQAARTAAELLASVARLNSNSARPAGSVNTAADAQVLTGIDVLERDGFRQLSGLRIGLITNHTGRDRSGRATIDVLHKAPNVKLVARPLFRLSTAFAHR